MEFYIGLLRFFVPLAASSVLMSAEIPVLTAALARMPNANLAIAAFSVALAFDLLVESPIYSFLQLGNSLATGAAVFRRLRRYAFVGGGGLAVVGVAVAGTPLFEVIFRDLMGAPAVIAELARPTYWFFVLNPLTVGWRRVWHGAIILRGHTAVVAFGTVLRLIVIGVGSGAVVLIGGLAGAAMASAVEAAAVAAECLFIWWIGRGILAQVGRTAAGSGGTLSYGAIWHLHAPLILSALMMTFARPLTNAALARTADPVLDLAAWAVALSVVGPFAFPLTAVQQVGITKMQEGVRFSQIRRFAIVLGLLGSGLMALFAMTPPATFLIGQVLGVEPAVRDAAIAGILASFPMGLGRSLQSLYQGKAVLDGRTDDVRFGTMINLVVQVGTLVPLVVLLPSGVVAGALAADGALLAEVGALHLRWRQRQGAATTAVRAVPSV